MEAAIERFFKVGERGSSLGTEVMAGLTTFLTMAYIVAVNPAMMEAAGIPFNAALTATCFGAAVMTAAMGLIANRPIALASGMGINAIVAFTLCGSMGLDWRIAMGVVFLEGVIILVLVMLGLREAVMNAIPVALRQAIGIGLFVAFIGLKGGGILAPDSSTLVTMGSLTEPTAVVSVVSIALAIILTVRGTKGGLLISIVVATIVGIPLGVTALPAEFDFIPDFSALCAPFQQLPDGSGLAIVQVFVQPVLLMFVFSLLMSDFFDTMGTMMAVGQQGDFVDEDGNVENTREILMVNSVGRHRRRLRRRKLHHVVRRVHLGRGGRRAHGLVQPRDRPGVFRLRVFGSHHRHGVELGHLRRAGGCGLPYDERHRQDRLGKP